MAFDFVSFYRIITMANRCVGWHCVPDDAPSYPSCTFQCVYPSGWPCEVEMDLAPFAKGEMEVQGIWVPCPGLHLSGGASFRPRASGCGAQPPAHLAWSCPRRRCHTRKSGLLSLASASSVWCPASPLLILRNFVRWHAEWKLSSKFLMATW